MDFRVRFFLLLAPQIIIFGLVKGINDTKTCMTQQCNISALGYSVEQKIQKPETVVGYTNLWSRRVAEIYPRGKLRKTFENYSFVTIIFTDFHFKYLHCLKNNTTGCLKCSDIEILLVIFST